MSTRRQRYDRFVAWLKAKHPSDPIPTYRQWLNASGELED